MSNLIPPIPQGKPIRLYSEGEYLQNKTDFQKQELARERATQYRRHKRDGFDVNRAGRTSDYILIALIAVTVVGILYIESLVSLFERLIKSLIQ